MTHTEYEKKWQAFQRGEITYRQWADYCAEFLYTFMKQPEITAIFIRMRVRDESDQVQAMV
jgi:hypothetical protein